MTKPIVFYDIANSRGTSLSFNTLKTQLTLIYKRIPYKTVWVPLADVEAVSKEHGFAPTSTKPDGSAFFTFPAIQDPATGEAVAESFKIAQYLDKQYPTRPVIPSDSEAQQAAFVEGLTTTLGTPALTLGVNTIYNAFNERSQAWWATRMRGNGVDITTLEKKPAAEQRALIVPALDRLAAALDAHGGTNGHFIGDSITFADLAAAAFVKWFTVVSDDAEYVLTVNGGRWKRLLDEIKA